MGTPREDIEAPQTAPFAPSFASDAPAQPSLPEHIGPYRILALLGEGGMGSVCRAEQRSPIKRVVAVKVIKSGFDTRQVIARFESERQALARMDHPNIARVLDAGADELGRPYFVMEYVPGVPLTRFCDENRLSLEHRLDLFCQVCDAIGHAHTKAIIHRDVKASNVLGFMHDGKPAVKVIDFGIAKALTGDRLTDMTLVTDGGRPVGTYDSMSPEQADASPDIDTRTDVYSLGVLLYELLAGATPFERETLASAPDHEVRRIIREVEPPRPDTRLHGLGEATATRVATLRQRSLPQLAEALRGELSWIPLKAMRKERSRRYDSPRQLADDVRNYLQRRPLIAGPESSVYRMRKWASRYRYLIGGALASMLVLAVATIVSVYFAQEARRRARLEAEYRQRADESARLADARAAQLADRAVQLNRQAADSYKRVAAVRFEDGDLPQSLLWLAKAVELDERDPDPRRARLTRTSFQTTLAQMPRPFEPVGLPLHRHAVTDGKTWVDEFVNATPQRIDVYLINAATRQRLTKAMSHPVRGPKVVRFSPDRRRLLTVFDEVARVWDAATGDPVTPPMKDAGEFHTGEFSPDGKRILLATDRQVSVWDAATGEKRLDFGISNRVAAARFSADGKWIYTGSANWEVAGWDATTGSREPWPPFKVEEVPDFIEVSPDGSWLAVRHALGKRVTLLNLEQREAYYTVTLNAASVQGIQFSADSTCYLVHGGREAGVWRAADSQVVIPVQNLGCEAYNITLGGDGSWFWFWDGFVLRWHARPTGMLPPMRHEQGEGGIWHAYFSPDGSRIVTGGGGRTVQVWDAATGQPLSPPIRHAEEVRHVAFDPTGRRVLTSGDDGARVFDARTGEPALPPLETPSDCWRASFSPDGSRIAVGCLRGLVQVYDAASGKPLLRKPLESKPRGVVAEVNAVAFTRDNARLAAAGDYGSTLWDLKTETQIAELDNEDVGGPSLTFTPDGMRLIGRGGVYDGLTGAELVELESAETADVASYCAVSPDAKFLAAADEATGTVRVMEVRTGRITSPAMAHGGRVMFIAFSPDGTLLATASTDQYARVFDLANGRLLVSIRFTQRVQKTTFSPDGARLLVACDDGSATLWSLEPDPRPVDDLRRIARVMSSNTVDEFDSVVPADLDRLEEEWPELTRGYPQDFPKLTSLPSTRPSAPTRP